MHDIVSRLGRDALEKLAGGAEPGAFAAAKIAGHGGLFVQDLLCPGSGLGGVFDPEKHLFHNYSVSEVVEQFDAFMEGLLELIPRDLINVFDERELELLIGGMSEIDMCAFPFAVHDFAEMLM